MIANAIESCVTTLNLVCSKILAGNVISVTYSRRLSWTRTDCDGSIVHLVRLWCGIIANLWSTSTH